MIARGRRPGRWRGRQASEAGGARPSAHAAYPYREGAGHYSNVRSERVAKRLREVEGHYERSEVARYRAPLGCYLTQDRGTRAHRR